MSQRETFGQTILVAAVLCLVSSLVVSAAAVALKDRQEANKVLDQQKNILDATGLAIGEYGRPAKELTKDQIDELYGWISERLVNLEDGSYNAQINIVTYDAKEAAGKDDSSVPLEKPEYDPGLKRREKVAKVYFVTRPGESKIRQVVLPVKGKGLWSTLYGYLALKSDLETVQGLTFYEHAETPGLGGEVDNPGWKAQWEGKSLYDDQGTPAAKVFKGPAPTGDSYAVDGLSGATITSNGVTNLLRYWASEEGYGPFLENLGSELAANDGSLVPLAETTPKSDEVDTEDTEEESNG